MSQLSQLKNSFSKTKDYAVETLGLKPLLRSRERIEAGEVKNALSLQIAAELSDYKFKSLLIAYPLWLFFGFFGGAHRFYLSKPISAVIMTFTGGGAVFWWLTDVFRLPKMVRQYNESQERRQREGLPPLGLDFIADRNIDISNSTPDWVKDRGSITRNSAFLVDCLVVAILCIALSSIATAMELYEPLFSVFVLAVLFMAGDTLWRYFHVPYIHELLSVEYKLKLFYFHNRPGNSFLLLFRPLFGIIRMAFGKKNRAELKLYIELGSIFAIPFILIEVGLWLYGGASMDFLEDIVVRIILLYFIIFAFTCPLGAIFCKQDLQGVSRGKSLFLGGEVLVLIFIMVVILV